MGSRQSIDELPGRCVAAVRNPIDLEESGAGERPVGEGVNGDLGPQ